MFNNKHSEHALRVLLLAVLSCSGCPASSATPPPGRRVAKTGPKTRQKPAPTARVRRPPPEPRRAVTRARPVKARSRLPAWAKLPVADKALRQVFTYRKRSTLRLQSARLRLAMDTKLRQAQPITWASAGSQEVVVEYHFSADSQHGWLRGTVGIDQLSLPIPMGTAGGIQPGRMGAIMFAKTGPVKVLALQGTFAKVQVVLQRGQPPLAVWVARNALRVTAKERPLPAAWRVVAGKKVHLRTRAYRLTLRESPGGPVLLKLKPCIWHESVTRRLKRRGQWVQVYFRAHAKSQIALKGWVAASSLRRRAKRCSGLGMVTGGGGMGGPALWGCSPSLSHDLPLYTKPDARLAPIGVLRRGTCNMSPGKRVQAGNATFLTVKIQGVTFYVPQLRPRKASREPGR